MTAKTAIYSILMLALAVVGRAEDRPYTRDVVLRGVLDMGESKSFSLSSPGGQTSGWAEIGGKFLGYELISYDREDRVLVLSKDGQEFVVGMAGMSASSAETSLAEAKQEAKKLFENIQFEETITKAMDAQMEAMGDAMRQQMAALGETEEEFLKFQQQAMKDMFKDMDWKVLQTGMEQAYAEVFTVDELRGMNEFYSTPAGKATIEKAPELQAKTMKIMMPEIMKASQTMQDKMTDYFANREQEPAKETAED